MWPLILNPHNDPRKNPRPACPRWQFDDCDFLGLQIHFGVKFCWVCGVKFVEGDIVWVYGEPSSFILIFCVVLGQVSLGPGCFLVAALTYLICTCFFFRSRHSRQPSLVKRYRTITRKHLSIMSRTRPIHALLLVVLCCFI